MCPCWGCRDPKLTILFVPHHVIPSGGLHWTRGAPGSPVVAVVVLVVVIVVVVIVTLDQGCAKDLLWFQFLGLLAIAPAHSQGLTKMFFLLKLQMKDLVCILRLGTVVL